MTAYLIVALGSGIGGALRHAVNVGAARLLGPGWPSGTFTVNVVGSFAIGLIAGYFAPEGQHVARMAAVPHDGLPGRVHDLLAFSLDVAVLYERGGLDLAGLYAVGSVVLSLAALFLALALVRRLT
jgi:CrcB protein